MTSLTRNHTRNAAVVLGAFITMLTAPVTTSAQQAPATAGAWRIEPAVGAWIQGDRGQPTPRDVGPAYALGLSRQRSPRARITATASYHRLDDAYQILAFGVNGETRTYTYDREIISATVGTAADAWQGRAGAIGFGVEFGGGFSVSRLDHVEGPSVAPALEPSTDKRRSWSPLFLTVPSVAARYAVAPRLELTSTVRFLLAIGDMVPGAVPTLAFGTAYRF